MKHILNNLTEEEKNSIREQHTGGMKVMTENFSKLLNSKLGDSKPLVNEQSVDPKQELSDLGLKLRRKYKNKICGTNSISLPFDADVKRYQELNNKVAYLSTTKLKEDGIIGPEMKKEFCTSDS
jgi:hypothetical protein